MRAEAEEGLKKNILVPVSIEDVKIPLLFRPIQSVRLIKWQQDSNHPQFKKLISDLTPILGLPPLKVIEAEQKRAEDERIRLQEQERKLREEEQKRIEAARKAEKERKQKEVEAKRKADEELKHREEKPKSDKPEPDKISPAEHKPDIKAPTEPKSPEPRKTSNVLKFGVLVGVAVLLIAGTWWWVAHQQVKEVRQEIEKLDSQALKPDKAVAELNKPEQIEEFTRQRDILSDQVEGFSEQASKAGMGSHLEQIRIRLKQIQIQKKEISIKIERFYEQVEELEHSAEKVDNQEQIKGLYDQRDSLSHQIEGFVEKATKVGLESQLEQLQNHLKQIQSHLDNKEKELFAARKGRIFVEPIPDTATVEILNIDQGFRQGMELTPGKYHAQVSSESYEPQDRWIELGPGEEKRIRFELEKIAPKDASKQSKTATTKDDTPPTQSLFGRYYGLLIGNNDYEYPHKLKTPINDVRAIRDLLDSKYGFRVSLLTNSTRYDFFRKIAGYRKALTMKDNLLIYYAGHCSIDEESESGYWLPVDAEREHKTNWIANEELTMELKAMAAKHILIVSDSCFSGILPRRAYLSLIKTGDQKKEWIIQMAQRRSRTVLTSGGLEPIPDEGSRGHSVFANAFLSALKENNEIIDMDSLYALIIRQVGSNARQTPLYSDIRFTDHDDGDFIFVPNLNEK